MTKRYRKTPAAPKWKPKRLPKRRGPKAANGTTKVKFYAGQFSPDELALIAACVQDVNLDDELWLQRVLNLRLLGVAGDLGPAAAAEAAATHADGPDADPDAPPPEDLALKHLVRVAQALTTGAGRMARLLRDRRVLSGEAVEGLAQALTTALDEYAQLTGEPL